ncbi:MAG TPA: iron ABC transporter permease [Chloroflexota bacterium]
MIARQRLAPLAPPLPRRRTVDLSPAGPWLLLALIVVLVLVPVALIVVNSFAVSQPGQAASYGVQPWLKALSDSSLLATIGNTFKLVLARQLTAFPVAVGLAWLLARTDLPGTHWLEFMFWVAFFLPALPVTLGWILLLDPQYGLINQGLRLLPFLAGTQGPLNIYSFWGIVWAHFAGGTLAIKVMLLTPAFRNMDASLEEAASVSGSGRFGTVLRVILPIMTPILTVVLLLSTIYALQSFEVEMVLGFPIRFFVFSTEIYFLIQQQPPLFASAMALSTIILGIMVPLISLQRWATGRRRYTTVTGRLRSHKIRLERWRWPLFALVLLVDLGITLLPFTFLMLGTFMKLFGFFNLAAPWTLGHWSQVVHDPVFLRSVSNTLLLCLGTAVASLVLCTVVAYTVMRTRFAARSVMDFASWLPAALPGIILGLGFLWLFLGTPLLRPLYGTVGVLIVATVVASMTTSVQILKSNFAQLGAELEEAARVGGGTWLQAFRAVLLPIMAPTLLLVGALSFITAARNVSTVALLSTSATRPLSLLQLDFMVQGSYESAAVVGVLVVLLTTGVALTARTLGLRTAIGQ